MRRSIGIAGTIIVNTCLYGCGGTADDRGEEHFALVRADVQPTPAVTHSIPPPAPTAAPTATFTTTYAGGNLLGTAGNAPIVCTDSAPVAITGVPYVSGAYVRKCDAPLASGGPGGVAITWTDARTGLKKGATVDSFIFRRWLGGDPQSSAAPPGTIEDAMRGSAPAAPWGMPDGDALVAGVFERAQQFANVWAYSSPSGSVTTYTDGRARIRYNQVRATSSHNTFDSDTYGAQRVDYVLTAGVRSVEYDIHPADTDGVWAVFHKSDGNNCGGIDHNGSLSVCLGDIRAWHDANPFHEVITIFIDGNVDFGESPLFGGVEWIAGRGVPDFDRQVDSVLGAANIWKPAQFLSRTCAGHPSAAPDLQGAVENCGWPTLAELRGKFILVTTGEAGGGYEAYSDHQNRSAFAAMEISNDPGWYPHLPSYDRNIVFYNVGTCGITNPSCDPEDNGDTYDSIANVFEVGSGVSRIYRINNTGQYANSVERDAHFIATNNFKDDGYRSMTAYGYPFSCLESYCNTSHWVEQLAHP